MRATESRQVQVEMSEKLPEKVAMLSRE